MAHYFDKRSWSNRASRKYAVQYSGCSTMYVMFSNVHFTYLVKIGFFKTFQSLNPGRAIAEIKKLLAGIAEKGNPGLEGTAGEDFFI